MNGFGQVTALQAAASAREGRVSLVGYDDQDGNRGVTRIADPSAPGRRFEARATSVDVLTADHRHVNLAEQSFSTIHEQAPRAVVGIQDVRDLLCYCRGRVT